MASSAPALPAGDSYMVVGNLRTKQTDHVARVAALAVDAVQVAGTIPISTADPAMG